MTGIYIILDSELSLAEIGKRLGHVSTCAVHYNPLHEPYPGEPYEVIANMESELESILIQLPTFVESAVKETLEKHFGTNPIKVFALTYRMSSFFEKHVSQILCDPHIWIIDDEGLRSGVECFRRKE